MEDTISTGRTKRQLRPTGITVIGWLWTATGLLMLVSAVMAGFAYTFVGQMAPQELPPDMPAGFGMMMAMLDHFAIFVALQVIVAGVAIFAGVALLRLKAWARTCIEVLSWLGLAYCVGFGILWLSTWTSMTGDAPSEMHGFAMMGAVMGVLVTAAFAAPLGFMIRYLRSPEARLATA